ncbi:hypothetical protein Leryth_026595 [Lithospermum erythrorhizon]|nr:hypothetical protein Leryth_026595 [Lithospermum erythrorhizon]
MYILKPLLDNIAAEFDFENIDLVPNYFGTYHTSPMKPTTNPRKKAPIGASTNADQIMKGGKEIDANNVDQFRLENRKRKKSENMWCHQCKSSKFDMMDCNKCKMKKYCVKCAEKWCGISLVSCHV